MAKQLLYTDDARKKLLTGAEKLAHAVGITLGPTGRNVIIDKSFGGPTVTKDGVTVSKEIDLPDPFENMGAKLVNAVAQKTSDVGRRRHHHRDHPGPGDLPGRAAEHHRRRQPDGRQARHRQGRRQAPSSTSKTRSPRSSPRRRRWSRSPAISANNDPKIGKLMADAFEKVGKDGVITVEEGKTSETTLEFVEGMQFDKGYISPVLRHQHAGAEVRARGRRSILIYEKKLTNVREMLPLLEKVAQAAQAAAHHRRGRRERGAGGAGRQQAPRPAQRLRREGPRLRRPPQGDARRHRRR